MTDLEWKTLHDDDYARFRSKLLNGKGGEIQIRFLQDVRHQDDFLGRMDKIKTVGSRDVDALRKTFTEDQFKSPTSSTERDIYDYWNHLTPAVASKTSFWAHVTLEHVRSGAIQSTYLATNGIAGQSGAERIDRALAGKSNDSGKSIDDCVRTVFRQLGGLPQARGNKSVFVDCPLARAWWRERLFRRAGDTTGIPCLEVGHPLRETKAHWEAFVKTMVSRNPILGMNLVQDVLASILGSFAKKMYENKGKTLTSMQIERICQQLCFVGGSRELGILDLSELQIITEGLMTSV